MARFTLLVALREFTPDAREGVKVSIATSPAIYPVPGVGMLQGVDSGVTDVAGEVSFDLVSLPGLSYVVSVDGARPVVISGEREDGTVVRLDEAISVTPSPIPAVDAAALRAEILALIEAGALDGAPGAPGPPGPPGDSGSSAGSEALIVVNGGIVVLDDTKAEGLLVGYRVKSSAEFTAAAGSATLDPGAYTFERTEDGWDYYPIAAGTSLTSAPPAPGWVTIATDTFTAADGSALVGRTTTTGGLTWVSQSNGADVLIQSNKAVFATGGYGRSLRLPLPADHADGLRVTLDYELVGGVGGVSIGAGVSFTPHTSGITLDGGNLYPGGSVAATALTGTTTGIATTGTMQVEFTPARGVVVRINGTQIATAQLGEDLKGQVVQINWEAATTAIDNLVIEAVA